MADEVKIYLIELDKPDINTTINALKKKREYLGKLTDRNILRGLSRDTALQKMEDISELIDDILEQKKEQTDSGN